MKNKVFFIAEISANHCGNFKLAKKLIRCAKTNGADAVKLQTYTANTMTMKVCGKAIICGIYIIKHKHH